MATLSSILGSTFQGTQGIQGIQGVQGVQGIQGVTGPQGVQGISNLTIAQNSQTTGYTLVAGDVGKHVSITTGGVTVPASVFSAGDVVSIYNNSASNQTITQGASATMYLAGTATTGNRTLAQRGICTVLCVASNTFVIFGSGLT